MSQNRAWRKGQAGRALKAARRAARKQGRPGAHDDSPKAVLGRVLRGESCAAFFRADGVPFYPKAPEVVLRRVLRGESFEEAFSADGGQVHPEGPEAVPEGKPLAD